MSADLAHKLVSLCIALMGVISIPELFAAYLAESTRDMLKALLIVISCSITLLAIAVYITSEYL